MRSTLERRALGLLMVGCLGLLPGCLAATAVGAGAGTGIYFTTRGAESLIGGSIDDVEKRTRAVFVAEGIPVTAFHVENSGATRELVGNKGDLEISVSMKQQGADATKTEVYARKSLAVWDKDYAQQLLAKIVKQK